MSVIFFWFTVVIVATSKKSIIKLRNIFLKANSQDTAPGILILSDLLATKTFYTSLLQESQVTYDLGCERGG
jgi:hypothetical protein